MSHGYLLTFAIEGTDSYGAGLTVAVRRRDIGVVEVICTDRRDLEAAPFEARHIRRNMAR